MTSPSILHSKYTYDNKYKPVVDSISSLWLQGDMTSEVYHTIMKIIETKEDLIC